MRKRVLAIVAAAALTLPLPASASHGGVHITTPYPGVTVQPGSSVTFDLSVSGPPGRRAALRVTREPRGWRAVLRGGGFVVNAVTTARRARTVQLEVEVPSEARPGSYRLAVRASSGGASDTLGLSLRVGGAGEGAGSVELETEFPTLQGAPDTTFTYDVQLRNNTPQEGMFALEATGPEGWNVTATPSGQEQASTLSVAGGETGSLTVSADPPDDATAGTYELQLRATGGGQEATLDLEVEITGNYSLSLSTTDERLNADVAADRPTEVPMVVVNNGTAPLNGVELSATPPTDWRVDFQPRVIESIEPGGRAQVIARVTPSDQAVAGDYLLTMEARTGETSESIEFRTTVKASPVWGFVGLLLIAAALGGLGWVFRRYGRR